jgi:hypothetical protein
MATKYWKGTATAVAQVSSATVTGYNAATTYKITVGAGNNAVVISAPGTTDANGTAAALRTAWNASTHPYCTGVTAGGTGAAVTLTADTAGVPFTVASSVTGGGGTFGAFSATTASAGPNDWSTAANWSDGAAPGAGDTVIFENNSVNVCWGLDQNATDLAELRIEQSYSGRIGLDRTRFATTSDGATTVTTVPEYREDYLIIGWDTGKIGEATGQGGTSGSQRLKLKNDKAGASITTIYGGASGSSETGLPAIRFLAAHASADVIVRYAPGGFGIACDEATETATVGDVYVTDTSSATKLTIGAGTTLTNLVQDGGANVIMGAAATITEVEVNGGTLEIRGDVTITTLDQRGGVVDDRHIKTGGNAITTCDLWGGTLNLQGTAEARTIGTLNFYAGTLKADGDVITLTTLNLKNLYSLSKT